MNMNTLEKVAHFQSVWQIALPHVPVPTPQDAVRWAAYDTPVIEAAILRTAKRFAQSKLTATFTPAEAYRYTSGTARHIVMREAVRRVTA
jgi:hypothetical protein